MTFRCMQILMGIFAAAATMPDFLNHQYDDSTGPIKLYSPVIVSSLNGDNVASSGIMNANAIISRKKRQRRPTLPNNEAGNKGGTETSTLTLSWEVRQTTAPI